MLLQSLFLILFHFLVIIYAETNFSHNASKIISKNVVDLKIYSNLTDFNSEISSNNNGTENIVNVCEEGQNGKGKCKCNENTVHCSHRSGIKNLNIRASTANFSAKNFVIADSEISVLEKSQIFPTMRANIESLSFVSCKIQHIEDGAFDELNALRTLEFDYSKLGTNLTENILTQKLGSTLLRFKFNGNKFDEFDPSILKHLVNLEELDMGSNYGFGERFEKQFPESLSKLKTLMMDSYRSLNYIQENVFDNLLSLKYLNLNFNNFTSLPAAINKLSNLKNFIFQKNFVETYKANSFEGNAKLEKLLLNFDDGLKSIEDCAFCKLPNLKVIVFSGSRNFTYIHENAFGSISEGFVPNITYFSIQRCNISVLPEKLLNWENVENISIAENKFACNCSNAWFFTDILSKNSIFKNRLFEYPARNNLRVFNEYDLECLSPADPLNHTDPSTARKLFSSCDSSNQTTTF